MLLEGIKCPACQTECKLSFTIADVDKTDWIFCSCGTIFHQKAIEHSHFNQDYLNKYKQFKGMRDRFEYLERVYIPLIEELTYGRRFLDVGFGVDYHLHSLSERGWIVNGIDLIDNSYITGDFETHNFKKEKFDFILMGNVLEGFKDPIKALYKAKELLNPRGLLLLISPDAELVYKVGMWEFGNWNPHEKWIMFSEKQLKKILTMLNFNVIMSHKNTEQRFVGWNHCHVICQKMDE